MASLAPKQRLFAVASPIPRLCRIMKEPKHGGTRAVTSNMSYYMNFTAEFHSVMSEEATEASLTFNGEAVYKIPEHEEDRFPICTIKSNDHHDRCWTIKSLKKATSRSSPVYLKKCEPERLPGRQLWIIEEGQIMLVDDEMKMDQNEKWRSYTGIPYLGVGQKLKTRRV